MNQPTLFEEQEQQLARVTGVIAKRILQFLACCAICAAAAS